MLASSFFFTPHRFTMFVAKCICSHVKCHRFMALFHACLILSQSLLMCFPTLPCAGRRSGMGAKQDKKQVLHISGVDGHGGRQVGREGSGQRARQKEASKEQGRQRGRKVRTRAVGEQCGKTHRQRGRQKPARNKAIKR